MKKKILIIDDTFPLDTSNFRNEEFTQYLKTFENCKILCTGENFNFSKQNVQYKKVIEEYISKSLVDSGRLLSKLPQDILSYDFLYGVFLYNVYEYILPVANKYSIPFGFTLYPGGQFNLESRDTLNKLRKICASKYFKYVVVTQPITYDYLIKNKVCSKSKIKYIWGVVIQNEKLKNNGFKDKVCYGLNKKTFDICFVAFRYTIDGRDKGYNMFVEIAKELSKFSNLFRFHVVGNFSPDTLDVSSINNIKFYGVKNGIWFDDFYSRMDVIISFNVPGLIHKGNFDGFPTTSLTEACLKKVVMICSDYLNLNDNHFESGKELFIVDSKEKALNAILFLFKNSNKIREIGNNGYKKAIELYSLNSQIKPRIKLIGLYRKEGKNRKNSIIWNLCYNIKISVRKNKKNIIFFLKKKISK